MRLRGMRTAGDRLRAAIPLAILTVLLGASPAIADGQITAGPPNSYVTTEVTIDQGERVTFTNFDVAEHDVLARDPGPDGKPLFRSELTGFGRSSPVEGAEYLTTGSYPFLCSLHPQMEGTLNVSSAGKPVPRPGAGPSLKLRVLDKRISRVKSQGALRVRITTGAAATVRMIARAKGKAFATGTTKLGGAKTKTVRLPLTRAGRRLVNGGQRIPVTVTAKAKDAAGKTTKKSAKATLR